MNSRRNPAALHQVLEVLTNVGLIVCRDSLAKRFGIPEKTYYTDQRLIRRINIHEW
jgi:hypothetical protein